MIAVSGVRSSWLMCGEEGALGPAGGLRLIAGGAQLAVQRLQAALLFAALGDLGLQAAGLLLLRAQEGADLFGHEVEAAREGVDLVAGCRWPRARLVAGEVGSWPRRGGRSARRGGG